MQRAIKGVVPDLTVPQQVKILIYAGIVFFQQRGDSNHLFRYVYLDRDKSFQQTSGIKAEQSLLWS